MEITTLLEFTHRAQLRNWLLEHGEEAKECWIAMYRSKRPLCSAACLPYIDVVEEALCFGWIDSTLKRLLRYMAIQHSFASSPCSSNQLRN